LKNNLTSRPRHDDGQHDDKDNNVIIKTNTSSMSSNTTSISSGKRGSSSCRTVKPKARWGKILLINAVNEVTRERAQSFLTDDHIERIVSAYEKFKDEPGFARVVTLEAIRAKDGNLSIPLYVTPTATSGTSDRQDSGKNGTAPDAVLSSWVHSANAIRASLDELFKTESPN
jgi:type I restriction enzyme M protein